MKLLHIGCDLKGGAGKNLLRHHQALLRSGVESLVLLSDRASPPPFAKMYRWSEVNVEELIAWADIVELRQLHGGGARSWADLEEFARLLSGKPVIWRLSDMWAFTGYCAYDMGCDRWRKGCGSCPQLGPESFKAEIRKPEVDRTEEVIQEKVRFFNAIPIHVVCPSNWMAERVRRSLVTPASLQVIPIGVVPDLYQSSREESRASLELGNDSIFLYAGMPSVGNYRKGFDLLEPILQNVSHRSGVEILMTARGDAPSSIAGIPVVNVGFQSSDADLARVYSAADVFLFPSRMDNSPQTVVEARCAGLPVVAFDVGGTPEYLGDSEGCRLIEAYDLSAFGFAVDFQIEKILSMPEVIPRPIEKDCDGYNIEKQYSSFLRLYREMLEI